MLLKTFRISGLVGAFVISSALAVSAAVIDFTSNPLALTGTVGANGWAATGNPVAPNANETGPGAVAVIFSTGSGFLAGNNDGLGIGDDEITTANSTQYITITFDHSVKLLGAYFLDLFVAANGNSAERAIITLGATAPGTEAASLTASVTANTGSGLGQLTGLALTGTTFTFYSGVTNDALGNADFALAAIEVTSVPIPAAGLLLLGALGGLRFAGRRRRKAT